MYEERAKSLRWLAFNFPHIDNPQDDSDKMCNCINLYCTQAADAIEELSKPRWIPVTVRLPEESERVLVACEDGVSFGFFEEIIADDEFVKEWHDMMYYPISVTHWMPLPEIPGD